MPKEREDQSLENFDFDKDDSTDFFNIKAGKNQVGAKDLQNKGKKPDDEDFLDWEEDPDGATTALDDAEKEARRQEKAEASSKKKDGQRGTTRTSKDDDDDEDPDDDEEQDDEEEEGKTKKPAKKPAKRDKDDDDEEEDKEDDDDEDDNKAIKAKGKNKREIELTEKEEEEEIYTGMALDLVEDNIFQNVKIGKKERLDRVSFAEKIDEEIEARLEDTLQAMSEKTDERGRRVIAYLMKGGSYDRLANVVSQRMKEDVAKLDVKKEGDAVKIIKHHLEKIEQMSDDDIEERVQYLKDKGTVENFAAKYKNAYVERQSRAEDAVLKQKDAEEKAAIQANKIFSEELDEVLEKIEKVGSFPITKKDKKELKPYITRPVVKMGKEYVPALNAEINRILTGERPIDKKHLLALAKIVKEKFNVVDLETEAETRVTQRTRSRLIEARRNPKTSTAGGYGKKTLADSFAGNLKDMD